MLLILLILLFVDVFEVKLLLFLSLALVQVYLSFDRLLHSSIRSARLCSGYSENPTASSPFWKFPAKGKCYQMKILILYLMWWHYFFKKHQQSALAWASLRDNPTCNGETVTMEYAIKCLYVDAYLAESSCIISMNCIYVFIKTRCFIFCSKFSPS